MSMIGYVLQCKLLWSLNWKRINTQSPTQRQTLRTTKERILWAKNPIPPLNRLSKSQAKPQLTLAAAKSANA